MNNCKRCGTPTPNKAWCSRRCRNLTAVLTCNYPGCRNTFTTKPSRAANGNDVHCPAHRGKPTPGGPVYVYVAVHAASGAGKVGVTNHPARRRTQLGAGWEMLTAEKYPDRAAAMRVETELLDQCTTRGWASWSREAPAETFNARVDNPGRLAFSARPYPASIVA